MRVAVIEGIDLRARNLDTLDAIRKGAIDYYATIRSLYRQHRKRRDQEWRNSGMRRYLASLPSSGRS